MTRNPTILCRCEGVTLAEVEEAIDQGYDTLGELRRHLRVGMGPCQGRTCLPLLAAVLARKTGRRLEEILGQTTVRPPLAPAPVGLFLEGEGVDQG